MSPTAHLELNDLPQPAKDFFAVMGNCLSDIKALNIPKLFPKLGTTHPNGDKKYQGMLVGCMDPAGNVYFQQFGELTDPELSKQILANKFATIRTHNVTKSMEARDVGLKRNPLYNFYSGAMRGTKKFKDWIFGVTGWPETLDDSLVNETLHEVGIIGWGEYLRRLDIHQIGLDEALAFVGIGLTKWTVINKQVRGIVERACRLTFS